MKPSNEEEEVEEHHNNSDKDNHDNSCQDNEDRDRDHDPAKVKFFIEDDNNSNNGEVTIEEQVNKVPDGGWGWFVVFGCCLLHIIIGGFERSDGILFLKLTSKFQETASATSWVCSLSSTIRLMLGPLSSALCSRFTSRYTTFIGALIFVLGTLLSGLATQLTHLYITYGVIGGIGRSLAYAPGLIIVGIYFDKKRGLATGIGSAGVGIGTFIIPLLFEIVFEEYDFFGAFLILSAIPLNLCVCAALFRPLHVHRNILRARLKKSLFKSAKALEDGAILTSSKSNGVVEPEDSNLVSVGTQTDSLEGKNFLQIFYAKYLKPPSTGKKNRKMFEFSLLKNPAFLFFCIGIGIFTASFKSCFTFLPALAKANGCTEREAALVMSICGIVDTISRIGAGIILELKPIKPFRPVLYNSLMFAIVIITILCPFCYGIVGFILIGSAYGLLTGGYISQKSVIIVDILGPDKISLSFGLILFFQGIGTLIGPPLAGLLKDNLGSFDEVFYFCAGLMFIAGLVMIMSNVCRKKQLRKDKKEAQLRRLDTEEADLVSKEQKKALI